ncbi:hypothetical protein OG735_10755 [Streptomyces sp. NBC_01210]|uniref:hypothetical protein n=1 Tax=Streptomyces sp. NBC_01210 TaxID=2903774 RepID=UPI002E146F9C|nr:hypothetical protein OG735_10755 [Streptomyces sp. NBC_01210]
MMPFEPVTDGLRLPAPECGVELLVGSKREEYRLFLVPAERLDVQPSGSCGRRRRPRGAC